MSIVVDREEAVPETELVATDADFVELLQTHPDVRLLLVNIVLRRLLVEKDAEIQRIRQELSDAVKGDC